MRWVFLPAVLSMLTSNALAADVGGKWKGSQTRETRAVFSQQILILSFQFFAPGTPHDLALVPCEQFSSGRTQMRLYRQQAPPIISGCLMNW